MFSTQRKIFLPGMVSLAFIALLFFSCQKELSIGNDVFNNPPDLSTKIRSSVSGFVTDENNAAVNGATVQFGASTSTTDKYGYFELKNIQVVKTAAFVTITKPGYFKGIKTYTAKEGKSAFFRIKLIPKTIVGTISGSSGGNVLLANGLGITLPAGAVVNAATNAAYTGTVNVAAFHINPTDPELGMIMPGDLRGINTDGSLKLLKTFGMAAVELTGAGGELLQIATGKKATLTMPIPASLISDASATIPLWYFDESKGLWKEEGSAVKTGNNYVGDVNHFSYWNCDFPFPDPVQFDCTIVDANNNPMPWFHIWISYSNGQSTGCHGFTDSSGYAAGPIPGNSQLILNVMPIGGTCAGTPIYTQPFSTTTSNISLGTISIPANSSTMISGTLLNCNAQPVTSGYVMMHVFNQFTRYFVNNAAGTFNFYSPICGSNNNVSFIGGDMSTLQEGPPVNVALQPGTNNIGNLIACGTPISEYMSYSLNGAPFSILPPNGQLFQGLDSAVINSMSIYGWGNSLYVQMGINNIAIAQGSNQALSYFQTNQTGATTLAAPITVHITEYGSIGQFIAGDFTGTVTQTAAPNTVYAITCNFRVRRTY